MTILKDPPCKIRKCKFYCGISSDYKYVCVAFPKGIPEEVISGANPHISEIPGDDGYRYSQGEISYNSVLQFIKEYKHNS